mgnify:CR=1 FL=1
MTDKREVNRRIKFAYYLRGWTYEEGDRGTLKQEAQRVTPAEYDGEMDGFIFCPACFTNLNRVPKEKDYFSNGRDAYFAHLKAYREVPCDLRSQRPEGKRYESYEEARKAIENQDLVIVSGFVAAEPALPEDQGREYDETPVEDTAGPISELPIARHSGESFPLPSRVTTVAGMCRNFPDNLYKYYVLPNRQHPVRLVDMLVDVTTVTEEDDEPRLYYGRIKRSFNAGRTPNNVRMTELACHPEVADFYLKDTDRIAQRKGIHDDTTDRIVLIYGAVSVSGVGLALENLGWGEYALLPEKYNNLLD